MFRMLLAMFILSSIQHSWIKTYDYKGQPYGADIMVNTPVVDGIFVVCDRDYGCSVVKL